ncbi:LysE family translocator [Flavobacteriaceae bacterium]|jgi:threonine/homoserine/homoserine lactone efflux protein|nr:LysE family translocator [Flavobacteriaceae bacterium]|tara:strand:- start:4675 stop:5286 length:612 start_codon:yes stop_codon:yes gene_type:complete
MHIEVLITFFLSSVALTLSPGPDIVYVISQSFNRGKRAAIVISLGLTTGLLFHTFFVVIGLSILLSENQNLFFLLKLIGSFYFIYLAFKVFTNRNNKIKIESNKVENVNFFKRGLLMNLLNPKVSLFFIALFPGFIFHDNLSSQIQFLVLGLIFWIQANLIFIAVSVFSNKLKGYFLNKSFFSKNGFVIEICIYIFISIWILK